MMPNDTMSEVKNEDLVLKVIDTRQNESDSMDGSDMPDRSDGAFQVAGPSMSDTDSHSASSADAFRPRRSISIAFTDVQLRVRKATTVVQRCRSQRSPWQTILNKVSGSFESGKVTAIMGPSGSGKTSLLNSLAGRITTHSDRRLEGRCALNEFNLDMSQPSHIDRLRNVAGYVMQDDILLPRIRVEEQLHFIANMVLHDSPPDARAFAVDRVIEDLKLERCRATMIGQPGAIRGVSGGERKRVAIAEEMVRDPQVLFLDEPTSGLDSETALVVCLLLTKLAAAGRTIVLTIHQPSSAIFSIFDSVILLSKGNLVCSGTRQEIAHFFEANGSPIPLNVNPADFILHVLSESEKSPEDTLQSVVSLSKLPPDMTPQRILLSGSSPTIKVDLGLNGDDDDNDNTNNHNRPVDAVSAIRSAAPSTPPMKKQQSSLKQMKSENIGRSLNQRPNFFRRVWLLLKRSWISNARTPDATVMKLVQYMMISLFAAFIFFQLGMDAQGVVGRSGALFAMSLMFSFTTASGVVLLFPSERGVFLRESVRRIYDPTEYFIAKSMTEMPFQVVFAIISMAVSYFIMDLRTTAAAFFKQTLVVCLVAVIGSGLGLAVGGGVENVGVAMELCPSLLIPQMLIAGVFVSRDQIPVWLQWFQKCSYLTWSYAAQMDAEFGGGRSLGVNSTIAPNGLGSEVLDFYGVDTPYGKAVGILVANIFAYRLIGLAIFWYVCKKQQSE